MSFQITTKMDIDYDKVANLLCSAFEGGSGYWCEIWDYRKPAVLWQWDVEGLFPYIQYPLSKGGAVVVRDIETDREYTLSLAKVKRGLQTMAKIAPRHFADFLNENDDADTGDVFLQCCLLGEIVYG